jgi:Major Facilitator Superfamily.
LVLMNMSGPVYTTFTMEQVEPESRAMVASLSTMASNFGWAFSPTLSGYFQVRYGFGPSFGVTILFYVVSVVMYYVWFGRKKNWQRWKKTNQLPWKPGSSLGALPTFR